MNCKLETITDGESWRVESSKNNGDFYTITRKKKSCNSQLHCSTCTACIHMYLCTCLDATLHNTVCKHIHYVHAFLPDTKDGNRSMLNADEEGKVAMDFADDPHAP